jgi:cytidylate kinase
LKAEDALELDNSKLTAEEQLNWILEKVNQIREKA